MIPKAWYQSDIIGMFQHKIIYKCGIIILVFCIESIGTKIWAYILEKGSNNTLLFLAKQVAEDIGQTVEYC